jgi:hypothetical protein
VQRRALGCWLPVLNFALSVRRSQKLGDLLDFKMAGAGQRFGRQRHLNGVAANVIRNRLINGRSQVF